MNRLRKQLPIVVGLLGVSLVQAYEIRTPIELRQGTVHYHYKQDREDKWRVDLWSGAYSKVADKAFLKHGTNSEGIAALFFGENRFRITEALTDSGKCLSDIRYNLNPFIALSHFEPRLKYNEYGVVLGADFEYRYKQTGWRFGCKASVPFRNVKVENFNKKGDTTLNDVCAKRREFVGNKPNLQEVVTYRLDFLAMLDRWDHPTSNPVIQPIVNFANPDNGNRITINEVDVAVSSAGGVGISIVNAKPVSVIRSANGEPPVTVQWAGTTNTVNSAPLLNSDGSGLTNLSRATFNPNANYLTGSLACSPERLRELFVMPTFNNEGNTLHTEASDILDAVAKAVTAIQQDTAEEFLEEMDISLDTQCNTGVGDLDVDLYAAYDFSNNGYVKGLVGCRFPTAKEERDIKKLFVLPMGNNGHFEVKVGLEGGYQVNHWLAVKADAAYSFVIESSEKRAAAFKGARIKNLLGPKVDADLDWEYFHGHLDFTVFHPDNPNMGFDVGYGLYIKGQDDVDFEKKRVTDVLGRANQELSDSMLEKRTDVVAHKVRGEVFHRINHWELFAGGSFVFAGRNAMRETDLLLGFKVDF